VRSEIKSTFILVVLVLVASPLFALGIQQTNRYSVLGQDDWTFSNAHYNNTFDVIQDYHNALSYSFYDFLYSQNRKAVITFNVTAGGDRDINFMIMNIDNYSDYVGGYIPEYELQLVNTTEWSGEFIFPTSDLWYFVFDNRETSVATKTIFATIDIWERPSTAIPPIPALPLHVVVVVVIGFLFFAAIVKRTSKYASGDR